MLGSTGVFIGGKPAARMGDTCSHGGTITVGCPTVLIGEASGGGAGGLSAMPVNVLIDLKSKLSGAQKATVQQIIGLKQAADSGAVLVHNSITCKDCNS
jgi:hypothetical protein